VIVGLMEIMFSPPMLNINNKNKKQKIFLRIFKYPIKIPFAYEPQPLNRGILST